MSSSAPRAKREATISSARARRSHGREGSSAASFFTATVRRLQHGRPSVKNKAVGVRRPTLIEIEAPGCGEWRRSQQSHGTIKGPFRDSGYCCIPSFCIALSRSQNRPRGGYQDSSTRMKGTTCSGRKKRRFSFLPGSNPGSRSRGSWLVVALQRRRAATELGWLQPTNQLHSQTLQTLATLVY